MTGRFPFRFRIINHFVFSILLCLSAAYRLDGAWAQESDRPAPNRFDLSQLLKRAVAESPEIGEAQSALAASMSALAAIRAAFYPRIEGTALIGPTERADEPLIVDNRITDPSPGMRLSNIGAFGRLDFTLTQPLYTFGRLSNQRNAARLGADAKRQEIAKTADSIALQVSRLYYALLVAQKGMDATLDADRFFDNAEQRIKSLLKVQSPNVSQSDLYMIEAFRTGVLRSRVVAQKGIDTATFALRSIINLPVGVPFEIVPVPLEIEDSASEPLDAAIQQAYARRSEFRQLRDAVEASRYQREAAYSDLYPSFFLAVVGSLAGSPGRDRFDNPYFPDQFNHEYVGVVAGARWEFDFGIKKARISGADAQYRKMRHTQKKAEMNIPIQVAKARDETIEWEKSAKIYQRAATASRKWVVSAFTDFDMGVGTAENLLRAIEKYGENQADYIDALFHYHLAVLDLRYATGSIRDTIDD